MIEHSKHFFNIFYFKKLYYIRQLFDNNQTKPKLNTEAIMENLQKKVKDIIVDKLGVAEEKVKDDAHFIDDLGADSLDTVELVMAFEEEFGVEIPDDDAQNIATVKSAVDYLSKKMKEAE